MSERELAELSDAELEQSVSEGSRESEEATA